MSHEETKRPIVNMDFHGTWTPGASALMAGAKNFHDICNQMPCDNGLEGVPGYTKVVDHPISATYLIAQSGIQLRQKNGSPSRLLVQAQNNTQTASAILQAIATDSDDDVPNTLDFESTVLHEDATGAGLGRFCKWPQNQIAYCNGLETLIYGGDEMPPAAFILSLTPAADEFPDPIDYTDVIKNDLKTEGNVVPVTAIISADTYTKLLLSCDGTNGSTTFTDTSPSAHTITAHADAQLSTVFKQFGTASGSFAGTGYLTAPDHADWNFSTGDWTIDFFAKLTGTNNGIVGQYTDTVNYWYLNINQTLDSHFGHFKVVVGGTTKADYEFWITCSSSIIWNTFNHFELVRHGASVVLYFNGTLPIATTPNVAISTNAMPDLAASLTIGSAYDGAYMTTGNIDEFRISKGIARHTTTTFTRPSTAYEVLTTRNMMAIVTNRAITSAKFYLSSLNVLPGSIITGTYWNGFAMTPLTLTDNTVGFSVDEKSIEFESTTGQACPRLLCGRYGYVYQFSLTNIDASIYKVTVNQPIQTITDIWDGTHRPVIDCRVYHSSILVDATQNVASETAAGVTGSSAYVADVSGLTSSEYIEIRCSERFSSLRIGMYERETGKTNSNTATLVPHLWNGDSWFVPQGVIDTTLDKAGSTKTLNTTGYLSWTTTPSLQEFKKYDRGETLWCVRLVPSATLSGAVWIDYIAAIPAPQLSNNLGYKFPMMFQNRPLLCNLATTGEGNRIDFGITNTTEGWNGEDSSLGDGKSALYIGGSEELICGCEIYNRLGSSIYTFALLFKAYHTYILNGYDYDTYQDYPVSDKIGCPAPLTLDTFQIFTSREQQSSRCIACWLSYSGPYMFDAGGLSPMAGIECYFDPNDDRCMNYAAIDRARGWFDPDRPQYNLQFPSETETENNVWLFYDFTVNKWYPKVPQAEEDPYLSAAFRVTDATGKQYIYGARPNGYLVRLEYGTTWDEEPIQQYIETGEIIPSGNILETHKIIKIKLLYLPITETTPVTLTVTLYRNGDTTGQVLTTLDLTGTASFLSLKKKLAHDAFSSCRLRFAAETSETKKGLQLLAWSYQYTKEYLADQ